jgi:murein DD-endopeptidase MepM/ murein hydrolase activator NlpD
LSTTQTVTVAATASPETAEDFRETAALFAPGPRLPYEVRINTGSVAPIANTEVALRLVVPESFARAQPPNYAIQVFAQILQDSGEEVHDGFRPVDAVDAGDGKSIEVRLRRQAFTNQRRRDGTFEAVVILASSRVGPPRRSRGQSAVPAHASIAQLPDLEWLRDRIRDLVQGPPPCKPVCDAWAPPVIPATANPNRPYNPSNNHHGTDYRAADGQAVFATARGTIVKVGFQEEELPTENELGLKKRGWGRYVVIEHCDGSRTVYAHLRKDSTNYLRVGHTVSAGEQIAEADNTGGSTGPHLHLEYAPNGKAGKANTDNPHRCLPYKQ